MFAARDIPDSGLETDGRSRDDEVVLSFRSIRKSYHFFEHGPDRLANLVLPNWGASRRSEIAALRGVSFEVVAGESLGIIGRNGSGKSTLLQIAAGLVQATSGAVWRKGSVATLLELGSGFNPDFSGRENAFL